MSLLRFVPWFMALCALLLPQTTHGLEYRHQSLGNGLGALIIAGEFDLGYDETHLTRLLRQSNVHFVVFDTTGGDPYAAMRVGRLIRISGRNTLQLRSHKCISTCVLAFMGGNDRKAEAGSIGLNATSFFYEPKFPLNGPEAAAQDVREDMINHFFEMGISPAILFLANTIDADDMRYLSKSEMQRYKLIFDD